MSHTIIYNSEMHIIESKFQESLTFSEVKEFISEGARIAKEKDCALFLTDYREATLKLSTLEIYEVPKLMQETFASTGLNIRRIRRAVIAAKDLKDYLFYETVTINRGQNAKVFYDIDEAKTWLLRK